MSWKNVAGAREAIETPQLSPDERRALEALPEWGDEERARVSMAFMGMADRAAEYYAERSDYDLRSAAFLGLALAVRTFEPAPGRSVALWVMPRVQQEVLRFMHGEGRHQARTVQGLEATSFAPDAVDSLSGTFARILIEQLVDTQVLDNRDVEMLEMVVAGHTVPEIAEAHGLSARRTQQLIYGAERRGGEGIIGHIEEA
jgi:hypothetical protein